MSFALAALVGLHGFAGIWLLLSRSWMAIAIGVGFLGHAANLLLLLSSPLVGGSPPILEVGLSKTIVADPLPQALILTAIVIGFGMQAFLLVLLRLAAARKAKLSGLADAIDQPQRGGRP